MFAKKAIFGYVILSLVLIIVAVVWTYINSFQYLTLKTDNVQDYKYLKLYEAITVDGLPTKNSEPIDYSESEQIKLKKGSYIAEMKKDGYEVEARTISLADSPQVIVLNPRTFTAERLQQILNQEKGNIYNSLTSRYPDIFNLYTVQKEKIYLNGAWYAAVLLFKDKSSLSRDSVRVVVKKEGGQWIVATKPYPSLSAVEYPGIPVNVLKDINTLEPSIEEIELPRGTVD